MVTLGAASTVREDALQALLASATLPGTTVVMVSGASGSGKSHVAAAALARIGRSGAITGHGGYASGGRARAVEPIMAALSELTAAALATLYDPQTGRASLVHALGVSLDVLLAAGLTVQGLDAPAAMPLSSDRRATVARLAGAAAELVAWTDRFTTRRALLIDDWWRAPEEARVVLGAMLAAPASQPLTVLLTTRDRDHDPGLGSHPILRHALGPLTTRETDRLLFDALGDPDKTTAVAAFCGEHVPPLPFDVIEAARALDESGVLKRGRGGWMIDRRQAGMLGLDTEARIARLDQRARTAALALACFGGEAPTDALRHCPIEQLELAIDRLTAAGVVIADARVTRFAHERLRQAILAGASEAAIAELSGAWADALPPGEHEHAALTMRIVGGLAESSPQAWRDRYARAAQAARGRGDAGAAERFAEAALLLHQREPAAGDAEQLLLREVLLAAANRDDPATEPRAHALIAAARDQGERLDAHRLAAIALRLAEMPDAAWDVACAGMAAAGIAPPRGAIGPQLLIAATRWSISRTRNRPNAAPALLDRLTGLAASAATIAYHRDPRATALIAFRGSRLARWRGGRSGYWHSVDAFLNAVLGRRADAARAGALALERLESETVQRAATLYQAVFFGLMWREPIASIRHRFREVTHLALQEEDALMASYGWRIHVMAAWRSAARLEEVREAAAAALASLTQLGEGSFVDEMASMLAMLDGLTGATDWSLDLWRRDLASRNHAIDLELSNLAGDWQETLARALLLRPIKRDYGIQTDGVAFRFHETLARLRSGMPARRGDLRFLREAAALNPVDHRARLMLIDAERMRAKSGAAAAMPCYRDAAHAVASSGSRLDAILTLRLAAEAASEAGETAEAARLHQRGEATARAWGVRALDQLAPRAASVDAETRAAAAERAAQESERLLMHVSHELRTPLQALSTMLDMAARSGETVDPAAIRDILASLTVVADDLNILGELARFSEADFQPTDLGALVRSEAAAWQGRMPLTIRAPDAAPMLATAGDRVRQILRNLLSNACKYGGGTPVEVALSIAPGGCQRYACTLVVSDRGPGVRADQLERIFDPLERGGREGDGLGTGLGLALARRVAERLGGTLGARNRGEGGAAFTLRFEAAAVAKDAPAPADLGAPMVLLVEDDPLVRRLLAAMLDSAGARVVEAGSIAAARAVLGTVTFDVALLDRNLPDGGGLDLLDALGGTPAILLTASAEPAPPGVATMLRKPVSASTLLGAIRERTGASTAAVTATPPEFAELRRRARGQIDAEVARLLATGGEAEALHRLAGVAAQFGWPEIAAAADAWESATRRGGDCSSPRARLAAAAATMRQAA